MRHYSLFTVLLLAAFLGGPATAQTAGPPVITSVLGATTSSDLMWPFTNAVTAGITGPVGGGSAVGLIVSGSGFNGNSTVVWVPSAGGCPIASCVVTAYASSATLMYAYPDDALLANPDPGARVLVRNPGFDSNLFPFPVNPRMSMLALPTAYVGVPYSRYYTQGGTPYYMSSEISPTGGAPGLNVGIDAGGGTIVGAPTEAGSFNGTASVSDAWGVSPPTNAYSINVSSLPAGAPGVPYSVQSPFQGTGPYTLSLTSGSLPPGLSAILANGAIAISGTPTTVGSYTAMIEVLQTSAGGDLGNYTFVVATGTISIVISAPPVITTTVITPMADAGNYSFTLSAAYGVPPYRWSISAGSLPAGLTLSSSTGAITGAPTGPGSTFTVTVTDAAEAAASKTFILNYLLRIENTTLPAATAGVAYAEWVSVSGGSNVYTVTKTDGSLPAGLAINSRGLIGGLPTVAGTSTFTVQAVDNVDVTQRPVSQTYTLVVNPAALTIKTASPLPDTPMGSVSIPLEAAGGTPPFSWTASGGLPPGVTLSTAGILSGAATSMGTYSFSATVTDSAKATASKAFRLTITEPPLTITDSLPTATLLTGYSATLTATGGVPPYTWSASGIPEGLSLLGATLAGTPTVPGSFPLSLLVTDSAGARSSRTLTFSVLVTPLTVSTNLPDGKARTLYSTLLSASGGVPPYRWSLTAAAPASFSITADGVLTGTPDTQGLLSFAVQVIDAQEKSATATLNLKVGPAPLTITTDWLDGGTAGVAFARTLTAQGGALPYSWTGSLPTGLTIDPATGAIGGTPLLGGTRNLDIAVTDAAGTVARRSYPVFFGMPTFTGLLFGGVGGTSPAGAQPALDLKVGGPYPLAISGTVTLTFQPDAGADDPAIVFVNGTRKANFTIAAGESAAIFAGPNVQFQTGTVAGVITLTAFLQSGGMDITPSPAPSLQIRIASGGPVITEVRASRNAGTITVQVWGYSTAREVTRAVFSFPSNDVTVQPASAFSAWYQSSSAAAFGTQFLFTQTFSIAGDTSAVNSVKVTLSNSLGTSNAMTAAIP